MKAGSIAGVLLCVALALALSFASSLEPTAPGMVLLALVPALLAGAVAAAKDRRSIVGAFLLAVAGGYAGWRAASSPVADFGRSDLMLLACGVTACVWAGWLVDRRSLRTAAAGFAVLALVNLGVALVQWQDPTYTPFFAGRKTDAFPSGLYGHYNHFANFLLGAGFVSAGCALGSGGRWWRRALWGLVAASCVGGIFLSHSRGAVVGMAVGAVVLLVCWLLDLKRRRVSWFGMAVLGSLVVLPGLAIAGVWMAKRILAARSTAATMDGMFQDSGRLNFASTAIDISNSQPWTGGGSRSFSYEIFRHWDTQQLWVGSGDIDFVHNELLQTATDYGWLGLILLGLVLIFTAIRTLLVVGVEPEGNASPDAGIGGGALAGLAAMLVQGLFSFVFHMAPDVILAGALIGMALAQPWPFGGVREVSNAWFRPAPWVALVLAAGIAWLGMKDASAWWISARPGALANAGLTAVHDATARASEIRPDFRLEKGAADAAAKLAAGDPGGATGEWGSKAYVHLKHAVERNPYDYAARLSLARTLDQFDRFADAEAQYRILIPLLDTREMFYRTRFAYGSHAFRRANALFHARRAREALAWALEARKQMALSSKLAYYWPESVEAAERKRVEEFIRWLEEARYEPDPDAVTPLGD